MAEPGPRERLISAAIALFDEKGYDAVTVEAIAQRAEVGRTTLFRLFGSKEGLVFPDHDALLANAERRLSSATRDTVLAAVVDAASLVFSNYLEEGELARARWRLISSVPALRDREIAAVGRYVRLFRRHLVTHLAEEPNAALRAELLATAVVTAHNNVLRRWLRGQTTQPTDDLSAAMRTTLALFGRSTGTRPAVVVFETYDPLDVVLPRVERALVDSAAEALA